MYLKDRIMDAVCHPELTYVGRIGLKTCRMLMSIKWPRRFSEKVFKVRQR